jgi:hypothetical protein
MDEGRSGFWGFMGGFNLSTGFSPSISDDPRALDLNRTYTNL